MARKPAPTIVQEELYPPDEEFAREQLDDARLLDLDVEQESPFLRAQKRVSVRRSSLPQKAASRLKWTALVAALLMLVVIAAGSLYRYAEHSWRFRIESSDDIEIAGTHNVTHSQIMEVMGGDIGRNVFFVPLAQRKAQLEQIPWVESASVMRFVPNRLKVEIHERTPVAFARIGPRISLMDAGGTLMELPVTGKKKYSFPVILGMNPGEPLSTRSARMKIYNEVIRQLDSGGARHSQDLSEVDLSDPDDVKVSVADPSGEVLVHLGSSNYLERFNVFLAHVREWRQQFDRLESVDLRYDRQIIVNPDLRGAVKPPQLSAAAAKAAISAGVKPAALVTHELASKPAAASLAATPTIKPPPKPAVKRKAAKSRWTRHVKTVARNNPAQAAKPGAQAGSAPAVATAQGQATPKAAVTAGNPAATSIGASTVRVPAEAAKKKPSPAIAKDRDKDKDKNQDHP
jgi:cell division protein FtsQ